MTAGNLSRVGSGSAVVYSRPDGHEILDCKVGVSDVAIHRELQESGSFDRFDNMERAAVVLASSHLVGEGSWQGNVDGKDLHHIQVDLTEQRLDAGQLERDGVGVRVNTSAMPFQDWVRPSRIGAVDSKGIAAIPNRTVTFVGKHHEEARPFEDGETIVFRESALGAPANVRFDLQVYAPATSPFAAVDGRRAMDTLGLRVESTFIRSAGGQLPLKYVGQGGTSDNDLVARWEVADPKNFYGPVVSDPSQLREAPPRFGQHRVAFMAGDRCIGSFVLDWQP